MNTKAEELALVTKAKAGDADAYAALLDAHRGVITNWIRRYAGGFADREHADDLQSEGVRAFAVALNKFDPSRGNRLVTVLRFAVRRYVLEYLQRVTRLHTGGCGEVPISTVHAGMRNAPNMRDFFDLCGPTARPNGACRVRGLPAIDPAWETSAGDEAYGSRSTPPVELLEALAAGMRELSPQTQHLIKLRYFHGWGTDLIMARGYAKPVSRCRVNRDIQRGIAKLRALLDGCKSSASTSGPQPESPS